MEFQYKWGEHISSGFYYKLMADGKLRDSDIEPDVGPFRYYVDAFHELTSCRINSMSVGPIPFTAVVEYFKIFGDGNFEEFLYLIRRMDNTVLRLEKASNKRVRDATKSTASRNKSKS